MNIDIALIPPGALAAHYCTGRRYQMALAGVLLEDHSGYRDFYTQAWKPKRNYLCILDNGAWESETLGPEELLQAGRSCEAFEIMAPDVINDPAQTWEKTAAFLNSWHALDRHTVAPRVAAIAHGDTVATALSFVDQVSDQPMIKTIAIGRAFSRSVGNPTARLELALAIREKYHARFQIHLLGFSDEWPTELQHCAAYPGLIRSLDTIAPFSYAYYGASIVAAGKHPCPRPKTYFNIAWDDFDHNLVAENIATLDRWGGSPILGAGRIG